MKPCGFQHQADIVHNYKSPLFCLFVKSQMLRCNKICFHNKHFENFWGESGLVQCKSQLTEDKKSKNLVMHSVTQPEQESPLRRH